MIAPRAARRGLRVAARSTATLLLLAAGVIAGCSGRASLTNTFETDEALARAVLDAVARNDRTGLIELSVTRDEFENVVWPTLPASRPEVGMPVSYVWQDTFGKSRTYLADTLSAQGGRHYELARVEFGGPTVEHGAYSISPKTRLVVRDDDGQERTLRLFGSIIRQNGRSKVFSYIVD